MNIFFCLQIVLMTYVTWDIGKIVTGRVCLSLINFPLSFTLFSPSLCFTNCFIYSFFLASIHKFILSFFHCHVCLEGISEDWSAMYVTDPVTRGTCCMSILLWTGRNGVKPFIQNWFGACHGSPAHLCLQEIVICGCEGRGLFLRVSIFPPLVPRSDEYLRWVKCRPLNNGDHLWQSASWGNHSLYYSLYSLAARCWFTSSTSRQMFPLAVRFDALGAVSSLLSSAYIFRRYSRWPSCISPPLRAIAL